MNEPKTTSSADELPFKDVPTQKERGWRPRARFLTLEEAGDLPIPTFVTFADAEERPKWTASVKP